MAPRLWQLVGATAVLAAGLHALSDALEWWRGFSELQLTINYLGFLLMPAVFIGLFSVQRPRIGWLGLLGAFLYGAAFVYFAFTTLYAIQEDIPRYDQLLARLGGTYTLHGALMVLGGVLFAVASLRADVLPPWSIALFLGGLVVNLLMALLPAPAILQTVGSTLRNLGIIGMGVTIWRGRASPPVP
jgi:hypothetical protein